MSARLDEIRRIFLSSPLDPLSPEGASLASLACPVRGLRPLASEGIRAYCSCQAVLTIARAHAHTRVELLFSSAIVACATS